MRYFGGKVRISKDISNFILEKHPSPKGYWEPFCGMCSVITKLPYSRKLATDLHPDLILLWKAIQKGWCPPDCISEEEYSALKKQVPSPLRGFVGFGCSFGGKWFGGYARDKQKTNYAGTACRSMLKEVGNLKNITFKNYGYKDLKGMEDLVIYCDPPYGNTTGFSVGKFNSDEFWEWVRVTSKVNTVYVSEYAAPSDFNIVWEKSVMTGMHSATGKNYKRIEKLFCYKGE